MVSVLILCSLEDNNIGDTGAQALAEGLKYCANMKELKYYSYLVICLQFIVIFRLL